MNDNLERVLDEGVASYARSEPLAGLEERILGRIRVAERAPRRGTNWWWMVACGVGLAAMALLILPQPSRHRELRPVRVASVEVQSGNRLPVRTGLVAARQVHRRARRGRILAKQAVFPTPSPLTAEERTLLALMKQDPEGTIAAFESLRKQSEPLEIKELVIQPLETGEGQ